MRKETICLLGGTGFVGQQLVNALSRQGYTLRVLTRRRERHRALLANQAVTLVETDVHNVDQLHQQFTGVDAVINLIGILNERGSDGAGFREVHVELPEKIVAAMLGTGVNRLLHMSALNANADEPHSLYLKTKGEGEDRVHAAAEKGLLVTSFQPSVIFGPGDRFFNRFALLLKLSRPVFPLACPDSRFAPVCVTDVAEAMCRALDNATAGERLTFCGPQVFTLRELVEYSRDQIGLQSKIAGLGPGLSRLQARMLGYMPGKPFSLDNYYALQKDSTCTENALPTLGITPTPIAAVVPSYLAGRNARGQYNHFRRQSRRQPSN